MRYENNERLRGYLERGAAGAYREHIRHPRFEIDGVAFAETLDSVRAQHPDLTDDEAQARAVFRLLTMGAPPEVAVALPSPWYRVKTWAHRAVPRVLPWVKVLWAIAVLALCAIAAHAEPDPPALIAIRNAMAGWPQVGQPGGLIIQFQNGGTVLATRPAGLVALNCSTNITCSFSGYTLTLTAAGGGGGGTGFDAITSATNTTATMHVGSGATLDFTGAGVLNSNRIQGQAWSATSPNNGHIPIWNSTNSDWEPGDPIVSGPDATGIAPTKNPVQTGALDNSTACSSGPCVRSFVVANGAPAGSEYGLIVRNIPSGTQTVSGTVAATESGAWNITNVSGTVSLPTGAATSAKQPALGTAGSAASDVITVQGAASMTKLLVTPDSIALPAHQSTNVDQLNGTTTDTNSGTKSAGTLRVVLATDQPQLTNKLLVTPDSVALPANQSVNVSQINGVTPLMGAGNGGTGSLRVNVASDQVAIPASQSGSWTVQPGNTPNTTAWLVKLNDGTNSEIIDPCLSQTKVYTPISQTANTQLIAGTSAKKLYVCHFDIVTATAQNISLMAGTGTTCGSTPHTVIGGSTAATGWNFAANGGIAIGTGESSIAQTGTNADNICLLQSGSGQISGILVTAVQ